MRVYVPAMGALGVALAVSSALPTAAPPTPKPMTPQECVTWFRACQCRLVNGEWECIGVNPREPAQREDP